MDFQRNSCSSLTTKFLCCCFTVHSIKTLPWFPQRTVVPKQKRKFIISEESNNSYSTKVSWKINSKTLPSISISSSPSRMPARAAGLPSTQDKTICRNYIRQEVRQQKSVIHEIKSVQENGNWPSALSWVLRLWRAQLLANSHHFLFWNFGIPVHEHKTSTSEETPYTWLECHIMKFFS